MATSVSVVVVGHLITIGKHNNWQEFYAEMRGWTPERLRTIETACLSTRNNDSLLEAACIARAPYNVIERLLELGSSCVRVVPNVPRHPTAHDIILILADPSVMTYSASL
jgi:hypothetical protein